VVAGKYLSEDARCGSERKAVRRLARMSRKIISFLLDYHYSRTAFAWSLMFNDKDDAIILKTSDK